MKARTKAWSWIALCVVLVAIFLWQRTRITELQRRNAELQAQLAERQQPPRGKPAQPMAAQSSDAELLRLRSEVAELRRQNVELARTAGRSPVSQQAKALEPVELPYEIRIQHNTWGLMRLQLAMLSIMADRDKAGVEGKYPIVGADGQLTPELRREWEKILGEDETTSGVDSSTVWPDFELVITDAADVRKLDSNTIVARTVAIRTPEGKWTRVYVLADGSGHRRVHNTPDEVWQGQ